MICGNPEMVTDTSAALARRGNEEAPAREPGHITVENYWERPRLACCLQSVRSASPPAARPRVAYDNADTVLRFMASSYLDLDAGSPTTLRRARAISHNGTGQTSFPHTPHCCAVRASARRGNHAGDFAWGLANVRLR